MTCFYGEGITFCGVNVAELLPAKPDDFDYQTEGKWMRPYFLKWREKIGKIECDCTEIEEHWAPWYGPTFYHEKSCSLLKRIKERPSLKNLWCYQHLPALPIDYDAY